MFLFWNYLGSCPFVMPNETYKKNKKLWNSSSWCSSSIPIATFKESYSGILNGTRAPWTRVPCKFFFFFFFFSFTYSCVSWRPMLAFLWNSNSMNLSSMQFFFFFKFDHPILNFLQIEFYIETWFWENRVTKERHFPN